MKKKIVLANALMNNGNRGCVALSISALYLIDHVLSKSNIDYDIYLPDSGWHDGETHIITIGEKKLKYIDCEYPVGVSPLQNLNILIQKLIKRNYHDSVFKEADFVFDIGQGDSFADIYGKWRFDTIDRIHKLARKYSKPYCILPQTIGPFTNEKIMKKACVSIAKAAMVMSRDKMSSDFVKEKVPTQKNLKEYIDVAFFLPYKNKHFDSNYIHVGLNISALLWYGGYSQNNQFGLKCDYKKTIKAIIDYFLSINNVILHLVPHVVLQERKIENDYAVCFDLFEEYKKERLVMAPFFLSPIDAKSYISGLNFFIGARMHSTIAAFSSGVPVVPMAYSRKFNGLFIDTLGYNYIVDMKNSTDADILSSIKSAYLQMTTLSSKIQNINESVVATRKSELLYSLERILIK